MKYMLLIYSPEKAWSNDEWHECVSTSMGICDELAAKGQLFSAAPLHSVQTATCVRVRNGVPLITDGPFAETTEQLGGYYLIDVPNLDEAIAIAVRLPPAKKGTVEIRPIWNLPGLPVDRFDVGTPIELQKQFMLLCYDDEAYWASAGEAAHRAAMQEAVQLTHELDALGKYISASPLHPTTTATSVSVRNGKRLITDGPFAETREVLGGYYIILSKSREDALKIAARHSGARVGAVEVRQVVDLSARP